MRVNVRARDCAFVARHAPSECMAGVVGFFGGAVIIVHTRAAVCTINQIKYYSINI